MNYDALVKAVENGDIIAVKAYPHYWDDRLLCISAKFGHVELVRMFLNGGADIHVDNDYCFHISAANGHAKVVQLLLDRGVDMFVTHNYGFQKLPPIVNCYYALEQAVQNNHLEVVQILLDRAGDIHANKIFALRQSAQRGYYDMVQFLINRGADIHLEEDEALRMSVDNGHISIVRLLLDHGANIHVENDMVLRDAARNGDIEMVQFLLDRGANIHSREELIIEEMAILGHLKMIRLFIDNGAVIRHTLPLEYAASNGHIHVVQFILDRFPTMNTNRSLYDYSNNYYRKKWDVELIRLLIDRCTSPDIISISFDTTIFGGSIDLIRLFIDHGVDIHSNNDKALRISASYGRTEVVQFLIDRGADISAYNYDALRMALQYGHVDTSRLIIHRVPEAYLQNLHLSSMCFPVCSLRVLAMYAPESIQEDHAQFFKSYGLFFWHVHSLLELCRRRVFMHKYAHHLNVNEGKDLIIKAVRLYMQSLFSNLF